MKLIQFYAIAIFLFPSLLWSQNEKKVEFGKPTQQELMLTAYPKDPETSAVELYSKGKVSVVVTDSRHIRLKKEFHKKIKVLDVDRFEGATIEIPYFHDGKIGEKIKEIKAISHYDGTQAYVGEGDIYTQNPTENWHTKSFTFPNVKNGSILEYTYIIESPYFHTYQWEFQGHYPTVYSEFVSEIPGNYSYRIALFGGKELDTHDTSIKKYCFYVEGYGDAADCTYELFAMRDVPAFKEEDYMLSKNNYISKVKYELKESYDFRGDRTKHTKEWRDVDKEFRTDKEMGRQLKFESFFEKQLPSEILSMEDPLQKAKAVYYFIQNHYTWNGNLRIYRDIDVKEAFLLKSGNISEINLSLINALRAAGLENTQLALSATRDSGIPNQLFPVLTEFNYAMAWVKIENQEYYLDATDKYAPFGIIPFRTLNTVARVMDFKNGSYWHPIVPYAKNVIFVNTDLTLDSEGNISGKAGEQHLGYFGKRKRQEIGSKTKDSYIADKEARNENLEILDLTINNVEDLEENIKEEYDLEMESEWIGNEIYLPAFFLLEYLQENPFKLESRDYMIEMGYPMTFTYLSKISIDPSLHIKVVPENKTVKLPEDGGICSVIYAAKDGEVMVRLNFKLNKHEFPPEYYPALKNFFSQAVQYATKEPLVFSKN
ncbi:MAG: DUF3857 domain-containing protein [Flavobacteriaceae bacterium]|nr:DUF3857 domain-containing protein [Flavobacteriaceae bacterium]